MQEEVNLVTTEFPAATAQPKPKKRHRDRDGVYVRGKKFWISYVDGLGRSRKESTNAPTLQQARMIRAGALMAAENRRRFGIVEPSKDTFNNVIPKYLDYQRARVSAGSYDRESGIIDQHLSPCFGSMKVCQIRKKDVENFVTEQGTKTLGNSTIRNQLGTLKHFFAFCVEQELIALNPAAGVKGPKAPPMRVRYLQPAELRVVLENCPTWLQPIVGLLAFTGMRRGEVLGLRVLDVDLANGCVTLRQTKNGESRTVWLNVMAHKVLCSAMQAGAKPTDHVFAGKKMTPNNVSIRFLRVCRDCGIENFHLHDLRHTAASWMRMSGADLQDVQKVLGHRTLAMTQRYAHLSPKHLSGVAKTLDAAFGSELQALPMLQLGAGTGAN
jgi:integrase